MSDVKRWAERINGELVDVLLAADFDALLAENARLREAGEALASLVDALVQYRIAAGATEADPVVAALSAWREAVGDE